MELERIIAQVTERVLREIQATEEAKATFDPFEVPGRLEHSMLNPDVSQQRILEACAEAREYRFAAICVTPYFVPVAVQFLHDSGVKVCSVAGFPHAAASTAAKLAEIRTCAENGADEIDVALQMTAIKSGNLDDARRDLDEMVTAAKGRVKLKAIYEQGLYTDEEKEKVLLLIRSSGVSFVKISNALSGQKAAVADVKFVRSIVGRGVGIKIDGGVKTLETAQALFAAGADRIGLSASVAIAQEALKK